MSASTLFVLKFRLPRHVRQILSTLTISRYFLDCYIVHFLLLGLLDANSRLEKWSNIFGKSPDHAEHQESSNYEFESSKNIVIFVFID